MPRPKRKDQAIARNTGAVPYGVGEQLADAQRQMPVPNGSPPPPAAAVAAGRPAPGSGGGGTPPPDVNALAAAMPPPGGGLLAPTTRPGEPVTTGVPAGPGAGPEALGMPMLPDEDETLKTLLLTFQRTGNPEVGRLLELVRRRADARRRMNADGRRQMASLNPNDRRPL